MEPFIQRLTEEGYLRQEEITFGECDRGEGIRMSGLLNKLACFAGYDYDARGMTRPEMARLGCAFLLSRLAVRIHSRPRYGDRLDIETWEQGVKGAHMRRALEMRDRDGKLRVSMLSDWVLVDPLSHKIIRPRSLVRADFPAAARAVDCPPPQKILLPREGLEELGVRRVVWSDLDGNGHLYSGRYGDIIWDFLPEDLREREVREFFLNYSREATLDQELRVLGLREPDAYRMEGVAPGAVCFTARCVY